MHLSGRRSPAATQLPDTWHLGPYIWHLATWHLKPRHLVSGTSYLGPGREEGSSLCMG